MPNQAVQVAPASRPTRTQSIVAAVLALALVIALVATAPFARRPTHGTELILPAYAAATCVLELLTAALLLAMFNVQRSRALLWLASGYLFAALMVPAWALTFPGVFTGLGIDAGLQATAAIAAVRRLGFPLFVLGYALDSAEETPIGRPTGAILFAVLAVVATAALCLLLILARRHALPAFMLDAQNVSAIWHWIPATAIGLYVTIAAILIRRRRFALDIWVCLVLFSLVIELLLISYLGGAVRLSVGWWAGRLYGLTAASIVLLVLLSETTAVYARLARSLAAERRARQNRLTAMEALSASIAHEVNQPLTGMITNADAALRWLAKTEPRLDKVDAALRRIVEDGHRASKVVQGIRTMFMKGAQEREPLDLNALIRDALRTTAMETRLDGIAIRTALDCDTPPVVGNPVQLRQVISNLLENGIDAIRAAGDGERSLTIGCRHDELGEVVVSIADSGTGISPEIAERLFDPFVSTKPGGMGMGLMFCRSVIEAHGGRLWTSTNGPRGTVFHFSLPAAMLPSHAAEV